MALLASGSALLVGCSRRVLSVLLDLPEQAQPAEPAAARPPPAPAALQEPPAIEKVLDPDSVVRLLPRDHAGNIDWVEAVRREVIRPRPAPPNRPIPPPAGFEFAFDFYLGGVGGRNQMFDAFFPHSSHTEWLDCRQCHPRIFPKRGTEMRMADLFEGKYCGECHGKVAFAVATGCERCHPQVQQRASRAQPVLLGDVRMRRLPPAAESDTLAAAAAASLARRFPPATFPHWVHRIRYQCRACHMELFEPRAGANAVTMKQIEAGQACGVCHDGKTAFPVVFGSCHRCHRRAEPTPGGSAGPGS